MTDAPGEEGSEPGAPPGSARPKETVAVDVALRLAGLAVALFLLYSLARPFFGLLLWSAILATALYPVYEWLRGRLGGRRVLPATMLTIAALVMVFGPVALILSSVVASLQALAVSLGSNGLTLPTAAPDWLAGISVGGTDIGTLWPDAVDRVETYLRQNSHTLVGTGERALAIVGHLAGGSAVFALAVVVAGFLYPYGPQLVGLLRHVAQRVAGPRGFRVATVIGGSVRAVARGVIGVALLQALLTGMVFLGAGVPHAGLLTMLVTVLCIMQVGALVVVIPVLLWSFVNWPLPEALTLTLLLLPISLAEHVVRPVLAGKGSNLPLPLLFLGLLAGPIAFGLLGLFLGPVILSVIYALVHEDIGTVQTEGALSSAGQDHSGKT